MKEPLVSIIIPVYNGSNYVKQAIDSALNQTYKNIEILVINDGSCDDGATEKIVSSYKDKIRYFKKNNGGVSTALNLGIQEMYGDYFSWLSHDDLYEPDKIEKQLYAIKDTDDIVLCTGKLMDAAGKPIPYHPQKVKGRFNGLQLFKKFLNGYVLNGLGFLIPKKALINCGGFDASMQFLQDLDMWLRLMMQNVHFVCLKDSLVISRLHRNQTSNLKSNLFEKDRSSMITKHLSLLENTNPSVHKEFLKMYLYLCVKDNDKIKIKKIEEKLKEESEYTIYVRLCEFKYFITRCFKKILHRIFNILLKHNGTRN